MSGMLCNSTAYTGYASLDIQQMMDDPKFSRRVSKSSEDACTLCTDDLFNNANEYQLQCPARSCRYSLCHTCMKRVFSFKYVGFYNCFICGTQYQLEDATHLLNERMVFLDNPILKLSFRELIEDLPNQFKPETIKLKKEQKRVLQSVKGLQRTITTCIMNPDMTEEQTEEVRRNVPNIQNIFEGQLHENDAVQEVGPAISPTCVPTTISSNSVNIEREHQTFIQSIWEFIRNVCSTICDNVIRFSKFVGNLILSLCTSFYQYLRYCPVSLRVTVKQQLDSLKHYFEHSHKE